MADQEEDEFESLVKKLDRCHIVIDGIREFDETEAAKVLREEIGKMESVVSSARAVAAGMQHAHMALMDALDDLDGKPRTQEN